MAGDYRRRIHQREYPSGGSRPLQADAAGRTRGQGDLCRLRPAFPVQGIRPLGGGSSGGLWFPRLCGRPFLPHPADHVHRQADADPLRSGRHRQPQPRDLQRHQGLHRRRPGRRSGRHRKDRGADCPSQAGGREVHRLRSGHGNGSDPGRLSLQRVHRQHSAGR